MDCHSCWVEAAGPVVVGPVVAGPVVAEYVVAGPVLVEPVVAEFVVAKHVVAGPVIARPVVAEPVVAGSVVAGLICFRSFRSKDGCGMCTLIFHMILLPYPQPPNLSFSKTGHLFSPFLLHNPSQ